VPTEGAAAGEDLHDERECDEASLHDDIRLYAPWHWSSSS